MGYAVVVDLPHHNKSVTFSPNISHAAMRHALDSITDVLYLAWNAIPDTLDPEAHSLPLHTFDAVYPGMNGARMTWLEVGVDAPKLRAVLDLIGTHPSSWVLDVLARAASYAAANQGELCFQ